MASIAQTQPSYILYDQKERESFLSQIGIAAPTERELFHKLCKIWSTSMSYPKVLSIANIDSATAKSDIENLMSKLQAQRYGILCTNIVDGQRTPMALVLCNQDDFVFYVRLLDEMLMEVISTITSPMPNEVILNQRGITIPKDYIKEVDFTALATSYSNKAEAESEIFCIEALPQNKLYIVSSQIKRYLTVCLAKLQVYFQNPNLLATIAQFKNTSLMELKKHLESRDTAFWAEICSLIIDRKQELSLIKKFNIDNQIFQLSFFIKEFLKAQTDEIAKNKKAEEDRQADMRFIVEKVRATTGFLMNEKEFAELIIFYKNKYNKDFQLFKDDFDKQFLQTPQGRNLPILVRAGSAYLHMDNISSWFAGLVDRLSRELLGLYIRAMELYIKHSNEPGYEYLYSSSIFEEDIVEKVQSIAPAFWEMLQRPNMVAEAIIYSARKLKSVKGSDELKQILSIYFYTDRIRFKPLSLVFNLNIHDIFRLAFFKLSILRQIFMKISGKFESLKRKFNGFQIESSSLGVQDYEVDEQGKYAAMKRKRESDEKRQERLSSVNKPVTSVTPAKKTKAELSAELIQKNNKNYSRQERDSAWGEFEKTLKK